MSDTLLEPSKSSEKMYKIDDHMTSVVAGLGSDANILIQYARVTSQRYLYTYQEPMPVEQLVQRVCNQKHSYTQFGGMRPFGVAFLFGGWDEFHGYQLYMTDPSGNYSGWKAKCIGQNNQSGTGILKTDYEETMDTKAAMKLAVKVLTKSMDATSDMSDKLEICIVSKGGDGGSAVTQKMLPEAELAAIVAEVQAEAAPEGDM